jgi:hypothetical protein
VKIQALEQHFWFSNLFWNYSNRVTKMTEAAVIKEKLMANF